MDRLGVRYDLLPKESDILAHGFWRQAFALLRESGAIHPVDAGKNAGCWVMDLPGVEEGAGEDQKVIVRSNGTVTYVGKDIAYQMWKLGLLGRDFGYRLFDWGSDEPLYRVWETTHGDPSPDPPAFGAAGTVYNVIDARQAYLQRVVAQGLRSLGHDAAAEKSIHFSYDMVAGVFFGAQSAYQVATSYPGTPASAAVGRLGKAGTRLDAATARARTRPSLIWAAEVPSPSNAISTWPARRSCIRGPAPR
jgi:arginyl-tRNA synthetase